MLLLLLALLLLVALAVIVASLALLNSGAPAPTLPVSDLSPYEQLWARVQPDGTVDEETALQAFALAIAPLPGVTPPTGAETPLYERMDGTFAIDWITPYLDQLTPDQRKAVDAALEPDPNVPRITSGPSGHVPNVVLADDSMEAYYRKFAEEAEPKIVARMNWSLVMPWSIQINSWQEGKPGDFAITWAYWKPVRGSWCSIHVNPKLQAVDDVVVVLAEMTHELFHCFQFDWEDQHGGLIALPAWVKEGQAEWVGETISPSSQGDAWWGLYLNHPDTVLWDRGYEAIGFYQHLQEEGIDPWSIFDPMLAAVKAASPGQANSDAYKAADALDDDFLDTWASGLYRDKDLGDAWYVTAPWNVPSAAPAKTYTLTTGDVKTVSAVEVQNQDWTFTSQADVVEIHATGHVRIHTDTGRDETDTAQRWLCTKSGGCDCPAGTRFAGPDLQPAPDVFELALTGSLAGANATVTGHALDEYCKPLPSIQPSTPCQASCPIRTATRTCARSTATGMTSRARASSRSCARPTGASRSRCARCRTRPCPSPSTRRSRRGWTSTASASMSTRSVASTSRWTVRMSIRHPRCPSVRATSVPSTTGSRSTCLTGPSCGHCRPGSGASMP